MDGSDMQNIVHLAFLLLYAHGIHIPLPTLSSYTHVFACVHTNTHTRAHAHTRLQ